jgi:hypothetical protein
MSVGKSLWVLLSFVMFAITVWVILFRNADKGNDDIGVRVIELFSIPMPNTSSTPRLVKWGGDSELSVIRQIYPSDTTPKAICERINADALQVGYSKLNRSELGQLALIDDTVCIFARQKKLIRQLIVITESQITFDQK